MGVDVLTMAATIEKVKRIPGTAAQRAEAAQAAAEAAAENAATHNETVLYGSAQSLTDAQKTQARGNIGAVGQNEIAPLFSTSETYTAGQYVYYNDVLYRFTADHAAGAWTGTDAEEATFGDAVADAANLKSAVSEISTMLNGSTTYTKAQLLITPGKYTENLLYKISGITIGTSTLSNVPTTSSSGAYTIKFPIENVSQITFPVFKTTNHYGSFFLDDNNVIRGYYEEPTQDTGSTHTMDVPADSTCLLLSISSSLSALDWSVTLGGGGGYDALVEDVNELGNRVSALERGTITRVNKADITSFFETGYLYSMSNITVGTTTFSQVTKVSSAYAVTVKIPLDGVKKLTYPMYKTSSNYGCVMCDENNVVIWYYANSMEDVGTYKTISIPDNAEYFILSISGTLNALSWYYETDTAESSDEELLTPFVDENRNLCLAAIKTDILTNRIPYHRGFLFNKMDNDNSLWYGTNLENATQFATVGFDVSQMRMAISPKDGRIIATQRDARNGIWVYDGTTTTHINDFSTNPMGWLYNSGVDFIEDNNGIEHCIFAEYFGNPTSGTVYNVWRGTYPYTSKTDWEIVKTVTYDTIMHFHMVRRDPWTDILYLTSGDGNAQCNWWYSEDYGENWTLLVNGAESGWPDQVCRTINFVFTADWIYWATDHGTNHMLCKVSRDNNGLIDISSRVKLADLPDGYATNSICYIESPKGIFLYDRVDAGYSSQYGDPVTLKFWDIENEELIDIVTLGLTSNTWGGSRGKCYVNYTNTKQTMPAMGFSTDTPCIFDLVCDNPANIGTIAYDVGAKTVKTVDY